MRHTPRKRFGQHFLHAPAVIERIAGAINPREGDILVEIGPGEGALTAALLQRIRSLHAVELDRDLIPRLQERFGDALKIHQADALRFDFSTLANEKGLRVVGNLPYNISTPLIFHLLSTPATILDMTFLLQLEVVQRLAASPGNKTYGRLSVMAQYQCRVEALFQVSPGSFRPPPKVDSALVRLTPFDSIPWPANDEAVFASLVNQAFAQRRKTLGRALAGQVPPPAFKIAGIDPRRRAETLSVAEFVKLSNVLASS